MRPREDVDYDALVKKIWLKYFLDRVAALLFLVITSPLFLFVILLILWDGWIHPQNRGRVFYTEPRISAGKVFNIIKFRTVPQSIVEKIKLSPNTESITFQPEKTWAGKIILKRYLDELPQLVNVLKGEMSLVGPRPHIFSQHDGEIRQGQVSRNYLKAGILGAVQACKCDPQYQVSTERMRKVRSEESAVLGNLDELYVRRCCQDNALGILFFDISLILRGFLVVFRGTSYDLGTRGKSPPPRP